MKADYKNWMPKGMIAGTAIGGAISFVLYMIVKMTSSFTDSTLKSMVRIILLALSIILLPITIWMIFLHRAFSYNGKRQMSKQIIEGVADYIDIPDGGKGLDIGCGSGALTIACEKRNPKAKMIGIDRWGIEYSSFSADLCERNAKAEGVENVTFINGDATRLLFDDETFDAVTSNYVYHNIPSRDRQAILLETLRTLKKGGCFAIHDIMSKWKYGDMQSFVLKLRDLGYSDVKLIDTTNGRFMNPIEATLMGLSGSALLVGRK